MQFKTECSRGHRSACIPRASVDRGHSVDGSFSKNNSGRCNFYFRCTQRCLRMVIAMLTSSNIRKDNYIVATCTCRVARLRASILQRPVLRYLHFLHSSHRTMQLPRTFLLEATYHLLFMSCFLEKLGFLVIPMIMSAVFVPY